MANEKEQVREVRNNPQPRKRSYGARPRQQGAGERPSGGNRRHNNNPRPRNNNNAQPTRQNRQKRTPVRIIPLGGLNEIGKNMTVFECCNDMFILDCGLAFPDMEPDGDDGLASCWRMVENVEGVDALLEDLKNHTFAKKDAFTVGEVFNIGVEDLPDFIGENGHFSTIFDFSAHMLSDGEHGWYDAPKISFDAWKRAITDSQMRVQNVGFEANIIENHDEPRGVSRFLPDYAQNADGAKMLGTVSVLLRGIPFIYQGQEIGMQNARWNSVDEFDDISTKDQYRVAREAGLSDAEALAVCSVMSRDNARTPMQWKDAPQAGFTSGTPWLKVNDNYPVINVEKEEEQPDSVLHYYRKLIALRKSGEYRELFTYGKFEPAYENADHVMAYYRILQGRRVLVAANFGTDTIELDWEVPAKKVLLSNKKRTNAENKLILEKCEVFVTECK